MTYEELAEKVAQEIRFRRDGAGCTPWSRLDDAHKIPYRRDARTAIASVYEAIKEPTSEMVAAWMTPSPKMGPISVSEQLVAGATRDWTAMLDASPLVQKDA